MYMYMYMYLFKTIPPSAPFPATLFVNPCSFNVDTCAVRGRYADPLLLYLFSTVRAASSSFPSAKPYFDDSWLISTLVEADRYIYVYRYLSTGDCLLPFPVHNLIWLPLVYSYA
jgi:hypothetical protein